MTIIITYSKQTKTEKNNLSAEFNSMSEFYSRDKSRKCAVRVHNNSKNGTQLASNTIDLEKYFAEFDHMLASPNSEVKWRKE